MSPTSPLQVMLVLSPPILLAKIILPCWDCYDFEAATLHEIGHFLGLGHPDNIPDNWVQRPAERAATAQQNASVTRP